jgi:hypothetical protein
LFAFELDRRLTDAGIADVNSITAHPGYEATPSEVRGRTCRARSLMGLR